LIGFESERLGGLDTMPGMGLYQTANWLMDEVVVDDCAIDVEHAPADLVAAVRVSVHEKRLDGGLPAIDPTGQPLGNSVEVGRIRIAGEGPSALAPPRPACRTSWVKRCDSMATT